MRRTIAFDTTYGTLKLFGDAADRGRLALKRTFRVYHAAGPAS